MNFSRLFLFAVFLSSPWVMPASSQEGKEDKAIALAKERAALYAEHFNRADVELLSALFSDEASYSTDSGVSLSGKEAVSESARKFFANSPGATILISVESARFLTPDVLVDKGFTTVTIDGTSETARYSSTQVNHDGEWLIAELQESAMPEADPGNAILNSLAWMIGKWKTESTEVAVEIEATWTLEGNYITRTTRIPRSEDFTFTSVEVIGFDPIKGRLRSWIFDNEGGFGEGLWREDANKWLISTKAVLPEGGQFSAEHVITHLDENRLALDSINRVLDGEVLPNRDRIIAVRVSEVPANETEK